MRYAIKITDLVTGDEVIKLDLIESHTIAGDMLTLTGRYMNDTVIKLAGGWMLQVGDR